MDENKTTVIGRTSEYDEMRDKATLESVPLNTTGSVTSNIEYVNYTIGSEFQLPCENGDIWVKITDIISATGQSGEASVYKVQDSLNHNLALKIYHQLPIDYEPNPIALKRIKDISDVDILPLLAYGVGKNKLFGKFCWELQVFANGGNLLSVPDIKSKYTPEFIENEIVPQLLKGIWKMHDNKIYHCDLKPQNIFYLDKEQSDIVIGDYGSAKTNEIDSNNSFAITKHIVGTRFYIPPELQEGFIKDNSDYFSMGMIILELLYNEAFIHDVQKTREEITLKRNQHEPIFNYDKRYEHLNKLIEGCTLASWDRRWNREDIISWQKGKIPPILYRNTKQVQELKLTRQVTVKSIEELVEYAWRLNEDEFYNILIQDDAVFTHIRSWIVDMLSANDAKNFLHIRNIYGLKGKYQLKEALLRYLDPLLPLILVGKIFEWKEGEVLQTVQSYLDHLLNSGIPNNPRIINNAIFSLEYALLNLSESDLDVINKEANYMLQLIRLVLAEKENNDSILGSLVSCDEQSNNLFFSKRLKLLYECLKECHKTNLTGASGELLNLVREVIGQEGLQQGLFKEAENKEFKAFELFWWYRFINPDLRESLKVYTSDMLNTSKVAYRIFETFYELSVHSNLFEFAVHEIQALDDCAHTISQRSLQMQLDRIATLIIVAYKKSNYNDKEKLKRLLNCLPAEYKNDNKFPAWEAKIPNPEKTLIRLAWICNPQRGIRGSDSSLYKEFTGFLLNHLQNNGNVEKDLIEANIFCSMKGGTDHNYITFYDLLKEEHKWIDQAVIKVENGLDVNIVGLHLSWADWSVNCHAYIYSSLVLRYKQGQKQIMKQFIADSVDEKRKIKLSNAFSLSKKNTGSKVNILSVNGAQRLEALIVKEAIGDPLPSLADSSYHTIRMNEIETNIRVVDRSYQCHKEVEAEFRKEIFHTLLRESFRWLSMAILAPLTWAAYVETWDFNPEIVPVFLYVIPLIILIGALPYFHKNQAKWWILALMGIILGIAFLNDKSDFDRMKILLSWQRWVILVIGIIHLISFKCDHDNRSSGADKLAKFIFWLFGVVVFVLCIVYHNMIDPLIKGYHIYSMEFIHIPGGEAYFQGRQLKLDPYFIAEREVTVSDFREFTSASNYSTEAEKGQGSTVCLKRSAWVRFWHGSKNDNKNRSDASWRNPYMEQTDSHPVVCVSFVDAVNFCNWLSIEENYKPCYSFHKGKIHCDWKANGYRLPTEAEWEWAAAGASFYSQSDLNTTDYTNTPWYLGDSHIIRERSKRENHYDKIAWYAGNTDYATKPVMRKKPNSLEIYDMIGNVYEWCWDWYEEELPKTIVNNYHGPEKSKFRCLKGGGFQSNISNLSINARAYTEEIKSASFIGFRVVRSDKTK